MHPIFIEVEVVNECETILTKVRADPTEGYPSGTVWEPMCFNLSTIYAFHANAMGGTEVWVNEDLAVQCKLPYLDFRAAVKAAAEVRTYIRSGS